MAAFRNLLSRKPPKEEKLGGGGGDDEWDGGGDGSTTRMRRAFGGSMSVSRSGRFKSKSRQRKSLANLDNSESLQSPKTAAAQNDVRMTSSSNAEVQTTDYGPATVTSSVNNESSQHVKVTSPEVELNSAMPKMAKGSAYASKQTAPGGYSTAL